MVSSTFSLLINCFLFFLWLPLSDSMGCAVFWPRALGLWLLVKAVFPKDLCWSIQLPWPPVAGCIALYRVHSYSLSWRLVTGCQRWESLTEILMCKKRQLLPERWDLKDRWELCTASESRAFLTPVGVPTMHESLRDGSSACPVGERKFGGYFSKTH